MKVIWERREAASDETRYAGILSEANHSFISTVWPLPYLQIMCHVSLAGRILAPISSQYTHSNAQIVFVIVIHGPFQSHPLILFPSVSS